MDELWDACDCCSILESGKVFDITVNFFSCFRSIKVAENVIACKPEKI